MDKRLVDIVVDVPKGGGNEYVWDEREKAIRFARTHQMAESSCFEQGRIAHTLDVHGEPLPALLAISSPTFPGCRVQARVIGAVEQSESEDTRHWIAAVAQGDACLNQASTLEGLPEHEQQTLEQLLRAGAKWLDEVETLNLVEHARRRARMSQVGRKGAVPTLPTWRMASALHMAPTFFRESTHFSWAEYALSTLPLRFQDYVRDCLLPGERILLWAYRPLMTRGGVGILGREVLRAGLAVLTDQQFLWLVDPVTPSLGIEGYGYVARAFALERLERALLETDGSVHKLILRIGNGRGDTESFSIHFTADAERELNEMARRLNAFVPRANETRLALRHEPKPVAIELKDPTSGDQVATQVAVERLQAQLQSAIGDETVFAQGFVPEWSEGGAQLLTVTERAVYWTPEINGHNRRAREVRIPLEMIGTTEICSSQLGSWFRVWLPTGRKLEKWEMDFPPGMAPSFNRCFVALRELLAAPSVRAANLQFPSPLLRC
jgi:inorganic pyrophosphatase